MHTFFIYTIGCQMNKADSERIAAYLEGTGLSAAGEIERADLVIMTTCGIRQSAEDRVYGLVKRVRQVNPNCTLILTGCLSERADVIARLGERVDIWLPIAELPDLGRRLGLESESEMADYLSIKPKYTSAVSAFVPIGNGCNNFCAYCVVPYARHREVYRPQAEISAEVVELISRGYREVTLIAQNVNSYRDGATDFPDLLSAAAGIAGDFWVRFATSHPKDMSDKLIETVAAHDKLTNYIHLPVQAGSDEILRRMNRNYTAAHYLNLVKKIRQAMPAVGLSTDIIVGFPGETEAQFRETVRLFEEARYDMAYVARYSPRPGTAAFRLTDDVSPEDKKKREEELMAVLRRTAQENARRYEGQKVKVLVEGRNRKGDYFGKTATFKTVIIRSEQSDLAGRFIEVMIDQADDFGLSGTV